MKRALMRYLSLGVALFSLCVSTLFSQSFDDSVYSERAFSAHIQHDLEFYEPRQPVDYQYQKMVWSTIDEPADRSLNKAIFGYLPYWKRSTSPDFFRYDLLSHLAIFSWEMSASGSLSKPSGWPADWTAILSRARESGVRLIACVTEFNADDMHGVLSSPENRISFIDQVSGLIQTYDLHGVNLDFESPNTWERGAVMNGFVSQISDSLKARFGPFCEISFAAPVVNWGDHWDLKGLAAACDQVFIMAYAFWGSWSSTTGPNSPLEGGSYCIRHSLEDDYQQAIAAYPERILLGIPYYGHKWKSQGSEEGSTVISGGNSVFYTTAVSLYQQWGRNWSSYYQVPWTAWNDDGWTQVWCDDAQSLGLKYELTQSMDIGGTGMWALAYDDPRRELWQALAQAYYRFPDSLLIADFEEGAAPFDSDPNYSGSTQGLDPSSTAIVSDESAHSGLYSLKLTLIDDAHSEADRKLRLLSHRGRAYLNQGFAPSGVFSIALKSASGHGGKVRILLDDLADGTEMTMAFPIITDGLWHEYEWNLADSMESFAFGNGIGEGPLLTLDGIYLEIEGDLSEAVYFLDDLRYLASGTPSSVIAAPPISEDFQILALYPNPFNSQITVEVNLQSAAQPSFVLYNLQGQRVWRKELNQMAAGQYQFHLTIENLTSGVYFLESIHNSAAYPGKRARLMNKITLLK